MDKNRLDNIHLGIHIHNITKPLLSLRITFCKYLLFIPLGLFLASGNPTDILLTGNVINKKVTIEGTLFRQPQRRANTTRLFLKIDKIETGKKTISADIKETITVQNKIYGMYEGQRIVIASIKLKRFTNYKNPGAFDIQKYYQRKGVYLRGYVSDDCEIALLEQPSTLYHILN